jgi:hypothetical protein
MDYRSTRLMSFATWSPNAPSAEKNGFAEHGRSTPARTRAAPAAGSWTAKLWSPHPDIGSCTRGRKEMESRPTCRPSETDRLDTSTRCAQPDLLLAVEKLTSCRAAARAGDARVLAELQRHFSPALAGHIRLGLAQCRSFSTRCESAR